MYRAHTCWFRVHCGWFRVHAGLGLRTCWFRVQWHQTLESVVSVGEGFCRRPSSRPRRRPALPFLLPGFLDYADAASEGRNHRFGGGRRSERARFLCPTWCEVCVACLHWFSYRAASLELLSLKLGFRNFEKKQTLLQERRRSRSAWFTCDVRFWNWLHTAGVVHVTQFTEFPSL